MIEKLRVRNFRCLRDVEVPLGPLNFLVGPNNTGKSSFLEAVGILCQLAAGTDVNQVFRERTPQAEGHDRRGHALGRNLTNGDSAAHLEYECTASWDSAKRQPRVAQYSLGIGLHGVAAGGSGGTADILLERLEVSACKQVVLRLEVPKRPGTEVEFYSLNEGSRTTKVARGSPQLRTVLGSLAGGAILDQVKRLLSGSPVYRLVPERIAAPCNAWPGDAVKADGLGLASYLARVADETPELVDGIERTLAQFVPGLQKVTFPNVSQSQKSILFHERGGSRVYASEASDGLLLFLAYLTIAYGHGDVSIVLIEEPETGVNPHRLKAIVELLRAISRGALEAPPVQVIATSHSPYLLDWCSKDEVILFNRDEAGDVRVKPLAQVPDIDERIEDFESLGAWLYTAGEQACESHS